MSKWVQRAGLALVFTVAAIGVWSRPVIAQRPMADPSMAVVSPDLFNGLTYRNLTNFSRGGRSHTVVGVPSDPATYYMGGANGGVFKTTDSGATWTAISDRSEEHTSELSHSS